MKGAFASVYTYKELSVSKGRVLFAEVYLTRRNWLWLFTDRHLLHTDNFQTLLYDVFHLAIRHGPVTDKDFLVERVDNLISVIKELPATKDEGYKTMLGVSEKSYEVDNFCSCNLFLAETERTQDLAVTRFDEPLACFLLRLRGVAVDISNNVLPDKNAIEEILDAIVLNTFVRYFVLPLHRQTSGRPLVHILQTLKDMSPDLGYHLDLLTAELEFKAGDTFEVADNN